MKKNTPFYENNLQYIIDTEDVFNKINWILSNFFYKYGYYNHYYNDDYNNIFIEISDFQSEINALNKIKKILEEESNYNLDFYNKKVINIFKKILIKAENIQKNNIKTLFFEIAPHMTSNFGKKLKSFYITKLTKDENGNLIPFSSIAIDVDYAYGFLGMIGVFHSNDIEKFKNTLKYIEENFDKTYIKEPIKVELQIDIRRV